MSTNTIQKALQAASDTKEFVLGSGSRYKTPEVFQKYFPGAKAIVVADEITLAVAGKEVHECLQAANIPVLEPFVFPGRPMLHADYAHIEKLREFLKGTDAIPIAVGSATINDLVKIAAYEVERRYPVVATAASMDGYSSYSSAIQVEGFKQTLPGKAPLVIIADSDLLRNAPAEMTAAGYADLVSKVPAGADWIIADFLGIEPIRPAIWDMVQLDLRRWIGAPEKLKEGDDQAFELLFEGLTMTGFAMQAMQHTRPASGADHMFSHIWEMQDLQDTKGLPISHGFKVGIGTLSSTALMEIIFARDLTQLDVDAVCARWKSWEARETNIRTAFCDMPHVIDRMLAESKAKYLTADQLRERLHFLISRWEELKQKVLQQIIPYQELRAMLLAADCPVTPEQINLSRERFRATFFQAQMIRNRYCILDLAYELGWFNACVDEIMSSATYLR
jgi:glycerol-1-phosphate dehydrogenase [NAD(P)+]